eukprot:4012848-Alexandrium_andersonii.AAC.1
MARTLPSAASALTKPLDLMAGRPSSPRPGGAGSGRSDAAPAPALSPRTTGRASMASASQAPGRLPGMVTARRLLPPSPRSVAFRQRCFGWRGPLPRAA